MDGSIDLLIESVQAGRAQSRFDLETVFRWRHVVPPLSIPSASSILSIRDQGRVFPRQYLSCILSKLKVMHPTRSTMPIVRPTTNDPTWSTGKRMCRLLHLLLTSAHPVAMATAMSYLGDISEKTVRRYVKAINEEFGAEEPESGPQEKPLKKDASNDLIQLRREKNCVYVAMAVVADKPDRLLAVYRDLRMLGTLAHTVRGTEVKRTLEALEQDLVSHLTPSQKGDLPTFERKFFAVSSGEKSYGQHEKTLSRLLEALLFQREISFLYRRIYKEGTEAEELAERTRLRPYTLCSYKGGLYLLGLRTDLKLVGTFAVERCSEVELHRKANFCYPRPQDYDPKVYLDGSFGIVRTVGERRHVRLRFFGLATTELVKSRHWHDSATYLPEGDNLLMSLEVTSFVELKNWILGFGPYVEVLEPEELRAEVCKELTMALKRYTG